MQRWHGSCRRWMPSRRRRRAQSEPWLVQTMKFARIRIHGTMSAAPTAAWIRF